MSTYFEPATLKGIVNWFDVKLDYGAIGNGVADDTTAINNAIAAVPAGGGVVFFPPGKYKITTLTPLTNPVRLVGSGRAVTQIISTASVGVQIGDGSANLWGNISIAHLTIAPTGLTPTKALYLNGGQAAASFLTRIVIEDVQLDLSGVTGTCDGDKVNAHYNVIDQRAFDKAARRWGGGALSWRAFKAGDPIHASSTMLRSRTDHGMTFSGPIFLPWSFVAVRKT